MLLRDVISLITHTVWPGDFTCLLMLTACMNGDPWKRGKVRITFLWIARCLCSITVEPRGQSKVLALMIFMVNPCIMHIWDWSGRYSVAFWAPHLFQWMVPKTLKMFSNTEGVYLRGHFTSSEVRENFYEMRHFTVVTGILMSRSRKCYNGLVMLHLRQSMRSVFCSKPSRLFVK